MKIQHLLGLAATTSVALGQVTVNGNTVGDTYCSSTVQTVNTQFGDNSSELNAGYGAIYGNRLYLALTGNLEANFNKLEIFIDSKTGGENTLSGMPGNDGSGVMTGFTFDAGFEADYHLIIRRGDFGGPRLDLDFSELGTANFEFYGDVFGGADFGSGMTGTGLNAQPIEIAYNGSNTGGVIDGCNAADMTAAMAVTTGVELSIHLGDIGAPTGPVRVCAFVNGGDHNFASNQFLGGFTPDQCNPGGDGMGNFTGALNFDLGTFAGDQFFTVDPCRIRTPIFGVDFRGDRFFTTDTVEFGANFRELGAYTGSHFAVDFSADATTLWGIEGTDFGTFDLTTGAFTVVGTLTGPAGASGLTASPNGTDWYLLESSGDLWVGDIATGVFTLIGNSGLGETLIDCSMNAVGELFAMSITSDSLFRIDTSTGVATLLGATGFGTNFAQGMDFDWTTNLLYATLYTGGGTGQFATLDLMTGAATVVEDTAPLNAEMEIAVRVAAGIPNFSICVGTPNSAGVAARMQVAGSGQVADNDVLLTVHNLPQNSTGYFLNSPDAPFTVVMPGNAVGDLCIASFSQGRHSANILDSGASGAVQLHIDLTQIPQPMGAVSVMSGTIWSWQYWYRDMSPAGGSFSNFSNARRVIFQ